MNKKLLYINFILLILLFVLLFQNLFGITIYTDDYIAVDYVRAKNIISENRPTTNEELEKYDVNKDEKLTEDDILIMRCLICEVFDEYKIKNNKRIAIKYISE